MKNKIIIGSRGSKLALIYAERARTELLRNSQIESIEIKSITTTGDTMTDVRVSEHGGKGAFCKAIEQELLNKNIRELKTNAIVGTSSFRREFQLKNIRKDLNYKLIRGNVDTRIKKLSENLYDAIILSYAGIKSLGLEEKICQTFSTSEIIPSAGQGVIALQCRENDQKLIEALKDMPTDETEGLLTNCFLERNNPREILISNNNKNIKDLKLNAVIGTSSVRREFQLKNIREDLNCKLIRGNVDTRIKKLNENLYDAIILSYAGIKSLGLEEKISQTFATSEIIPSAGQGVIALQCRKNDQELIEVLNKVNHKPTHNCTKAERNVLKVLEGNCETAVGAFAKIDKNKIDLVAELFSLDGKQRFYLKLSKDLKLASELGKEVGEILKKQSNNSYKK